MVESFPDIVGRLKAILERFMTTLDCVDADFISDHTLDQLPQLSQVGKTGVGGVDMNPADAHRPGTGYFTNGLRRGRTPHQSTSHGGPNSRRLHRPSGAEVHGIAMERPLTAERAIRDADLVVAVTTTTTSYIEYAWLSRGSMVVNVSLDDFTPEVMLRSARLVVDDSALTCADRKRLLGRMYREGLIAGPDVADTNGAIRRVDAELGEIINGSRPGRTSQDEIVVVNPFGLSIEDIAVASRVRERARLREIGTWLVDDPI